MQRTQFIALSLLLAAAAPAWPQAAAPLPNDTVVLRAGTFNLTKLDYEDLVLGFVRAAGAVTTGSGPQSKQSGQEVARILTLVSEAQRRKIDQRPDIAALIRVRGYVILTNALLDTLLTEAKKDEAGTRLLWESEKTNYQEVRTRQILVRFKGAKTQGPTAKPATRSEAQAKAVAIALQAKLRSGADFAALAKTNSDDEATSKLGGELPSFTRGAMLSEFEMVAFELPVGGISEPFKTVYGYHLVQVVERRPFPFERVRPTLEFLRAKKMLEEIASSGVTLDDTYFAR